MSIGVDVNMGVGLQAAASLSLTLVACLAASIVLEAGLAAALFRVRDGRELLIVALAQAATNPPLVLATSLAGGMIGSTTALWALLLLLEAAAALAEGRIYQVAGISKRPYALSLACNAGSFVLGLAAQAAWLFIA